MNRIRQAYYVLFEYACRIICGVCLRKYNEDDGDLGDVLSTELLTPSDSQWRDHCDFCEHKMEARQHNTGNRPAFWRAS